jgi:triphosphatase
MQSRDYMLQQDPTVAPRNAEMVCLDPDQHADQATYDIFHECLEQIAANMTVAQNLANPEGAHQLRVGLRRLRSAFAALSAVLKSPEMSRLGQEARWLGHEVGRVRDLDVLGNEIVPREAEADPKQHGFPELADSLRREVTKRRNDLSRFLTEARAQDFLGDLMRFVETHGWNGAEGLNCTKQLTIHVRKLARKALSKSWKKVRKRGRRIKSPNAEQRHELRKALKKFRYTVEFFSSLYPAKDLKRFSTRLKKLQKLCGDVNDAVMVKAMLSGKGALSNANQKSQRAMGWVIGASQVRAEFGWDGAKVQWRKLRKLQPFWG